MAKVIGLSGPQGSGKTTLLNGLKGVGIHVDDFKVSREVQKQLGWDSLERVLEEVDTMMEFQSTILNVKREREEQNRARTDVDIILTERTFADIAVYTQLWSFELAHIGKWSLDRAMGFAADFMSDCADLQTNYAGNLILPFMQHIAWQADPHRAQRHQVEFVDNELDHFFRVMHPKSVPVFTLTQGSIPGRIEQVHEWIKTL